MGAFFTVIVCCLASQCVVKMSKTYRLQLNRYYNKKRYEKAKMIESYLNNEEEAAARGANLDLNLGVGVPVHRSINSEGSSSNFSDDIIKKHKPIKSSKSHDE